jgi:uncharacterized protein
VSGLASLLAALFAFASPSGEATADLAGVAVTMRDGVRLRADVRKPSAEGRFPTLVYRTPYDRRRESESDVVKAAVSAGYAVVLVDVRGRYESAEPAYRQPFREGAPRAHRAVRQLYAALLA